MHAKHIAHVYLHTGVMLEAKNWIQPLLDNQALQKSFLTYSKSPRLKQKLEKLLNYVCSYTLCIHCVRLSITCA